MPSPLTPRADFQRQAAEVLELARPQLEDFAARPDVRVLLERAHSDISDTLIKRGRACLSSHN